MDANMGSPILSNIIIRFCFSCSLLLIICLISSNSADAHELAHAGGEQTHHLHHLLQITSLLPPLNYSSCKHSSKGLNKNASLKVVHSHGPCSHPHKDAPNAPTLSHILLQEQARVNSIHASRLPKNSTSKNLQNSEATTLPVDLGAPLGIASYIVILALGTPPKNLNLILDTGGGLTWTQCQPCSTSCYKQIDPVFDPAQSSSYSNVSCNSTQCSELAPSPCCSDSTCFYQIAYADQSYTTGWFGRETLTLTPSDKVGNFLFGCGQDNKGLYGQTAGILGLSRDEVSIVSQTAQKYGRVFSYCLPSSTSSAGHLTFGNLGAVSSSIQYTPLLDSDPSYYSLDMVAISVAGEKLQVPATVFSTAGTILDAGTVITRLPPAAYAALRTAFREKMSIYPMAEPYSIFDTCYDLSHNETVEIPKIGLYFGGNVEVDIYVTGTIYGPSVEQLCLPFAGNSNAGDLAIIGSRQQITFDVVFDVAGGRLGFGPGGCE